MREVLFFRQLNCSTVSLDQRLKEPTVAFVLVEHCSQASTCGRTQPDPEIGLHLTKR